MRHRDFLDSLDSRSQVWGVKRLFPAVRVLFGRSGTAYLALAMTVVLLPEIGLSALSVTTGQFGLLVWCLLALWGMLAATTSPTGIGLLTSLLLAAIGLGISSFAGFWHLVGGILPASRGLASVP